MLSKEQNERLTRVGPGTPAGRLLRNYWFPVAAVSELTKRPTKKVRLLGEDLVLYRDRSGRYGLLAERCPHRSATLAYGIAENDGLRCMYHGWLFDQQGRCLEQPNEPEDSTFKDRIKTTAYRVEELGALLFAYLGPEPAPLLPRYDLFVREDVIRTIGVAVVPANWLQIMENSLDPTHLEWLHGRYFEQLWELEGRDMKNWAFSKHHLKIGFDLFEYGIIKRRVLVGQTEENDDWAIGHPVIFPNMLRVGDGALHTFQIRVPMDDTHTYHVWYSCFIKPDHVQIPEAYPISFYTVPMQDETGQYITDYVDGQDIMAWASQGGITDRSIEHLGTTDKGIILYRKLVQQFSIGIPVFPRSILISEPELAASMIEFMGQKDICLLRGHGVSVTGRTVEEATVRALNFNALARVTLQVAQSGREANDISLQDREALPDLGSIFNTTWVWRYYVRLVEACKTPRNYWI